MHDWTRPPPGHPGHLAQGRAGATLPHPPPHTKKKKKKKISQGSATISGGQPPSPGMVGPPKRTTRPGISWPRMRRASRLLSQRSEPMRRPGQGDPAAVQRVPWHCLAGPGHDGAVHSWLGSGALPRLKELAPAADQITEPTAPRARALLDQYIAAFENADAAALERLLLEDAIIEATPLRTSFASSETSVSFLHQPRPGIAR